MKSFLQNLQCKMANGMRGRYGGDSLANACIAASVILLVVDMALGTGLLAVLAYALLVWTLFRCFSRNIGKRRSEDEAWRRAVAKPKSAWKTASIMWRDRKTTKYFRCPQCRTLLWVPKGKGTLRVTCPYCKNKHEIES